MTREDLPRLVAVAAPQLSAYIACMKPSLRRVAVLTVTLLVAACGARTGLLGPEETDGSLADVHHTDAPRDVSPEADAAEEDAIPPMDAIVPDVPIFTDCPDAGSTLVYVITATNDLYSFYPPTLGFTKIGTIQCQGKIQPNSMAVDRPGIAFTGFLDGTLFEISTANAACKGRRTNPIRTASPRSAWATRRCPTAATRCSSSRSTSCSPRRASA